MQRKPLSEGTAPGLENWRETFSELIDLRGNTPLDNKEEIWNIYIYIITHYNITCI
jgi:hypothetical protein